MPALTTGPTSSRFLCGFEDSTWVVRFAQLACLLLSHLPKRVLPLFDEDVRRFALGLTYTAANLL